MDLAVTLFRLLQCVCRRALLLADVSRSTTRILPLKLRPTLLVNQPDLSLKTQALWRASNYQGLLVPGNGGTFLNVACSKALFLGLEREAGVWFDSAFHLALPQARRGGSIPSESELSQVANRFQPQMLMFRLKHFGGIGNTQPAPSQSNLPACIEEDPTFLEAVTPLLERQKQDALARRATDVTVLVEVLWGASHQSSEISVTELAGLTNALLRDRGEVIEFSSEDVGWRLKSLGLYRQRTARGMILRFSREHKMRIHLSARQLGLTLPPVDGCPDCNSLEPGAAP